MKRAHRRAHRTLWLMLTVAIPAILAAAFLLRQDLAPDLPAQQLAPPISAAN